MSNFPNQAVVYLEGNPVEMVSLLTDSATPANSPKSIAGSERKQIMLCDPLTGLPLDLQNNSGGGHVATDTIWQAAGDLAVGTGLHTATILPKGSALNYLRVNAGGTALEYGIPAGSGDMVLGSTQTVTGAKTFVDNALLLAGSVSGIVTLHAPTVAGASSWSFQAATDTVVGRATTDTLTGKTFDTAGAGNVFKVNGTTISTVSGTGAAVLATSPTLVTPNLGTPSALTLSNATGLPLAGLTGLGSGVATMLGTFSSANIAAACTDETGTGSLVFANSPVLVTPNLGTPSVLMLPNATGLPLAGLTGLGSGVATMLGTFSSANILAACTDETGTGSLVFGTAPTMSAATLNGITKTPGAAVVAAAAMAALAIDVTSMGNTKSVAANSTFTFSGTPANNDQWFAVLVANTDTNPHILTIPSAFSVVTQAARTAVPISASGKMKLFFHYDGTGYNVYGDSPFLSNFIASSNPTVSNDNTQGYGVGSMWVNTTSGALYVCSNAATGAAVWNAPSGSGTVTHTGSLTSNAIVLGNGSADTKVSTGITSDGAAALTLGVAGTTVGTIVLNNATSGSQTISPPTGALGTQNLTMPNVGSGNTRSIATDQVVNSYSTAVTFALTDSNNVSMHPSADTTARTWTIPANASVAFPVGAHLFIKNQLSAGTLTIAITTDTLTKVGAAGGTGSRTLAAGGEASILKVDATHWEIVGTAELT